MLGAEFLQTAPTNSSTSRGRPCGAGRAGAASARGDDRLWPPAELSGRASNPLSHRTRKKPGLPRERQLNTQHRPIGAPRVTTKLHRTVRAAFGRA